MRCLVFLALLAPSVVLADDIVIREGLGIRVPGSRRSAIHVDPVELQMLSGTWKSPVSGEGGWTSAKANDKGEFTGGPTNGGYLYTTVEAPTKRVMFLEASGHTMVYVNGVPRTGDPYSYGYLSLPIELQKGRNELLFLCGRGRLQAKLIDPAKPVAFDLRDATLPDITPGWKGPLWAGVVVRNASTNWLRGARIRSGRYSESLDIPPLGLRKAKVRLSPDANGKFAVEVVQGGKSLDRSEGTLRVLKRGEPYKVTFVSQIDGSVQYYAVNPSTRDSQDQALFLSLHGASVEALGQAQAYSPKSWGNLVAATNRRPYGFDWEEIGRLDALEVLDLAKEQFKPDSSRIYLTGHSMGGHGTWQIGAHFPNLFAAIAPSAGWISFQSYAGGVSYSNPTPVEKILERASNSSNTLGLKFNYAPRGVFVLHGDADDNVPVEQARTMRQELEPFHRDVSWHEEKGAGHWWDASDEPGADAVDYAGIFEFFAKHRLPRGNEVRTVDFTTESPGVSATLHWLTIYQQERPFEFSRAQIQAFPLAGKFVGTTSNVQLLSLTVGPLIQREKMKIELDGQTLEPSWPTVDRVYLRKIGGKWQVGGPPADSEKGPQRYGGFKDIFRNRVALVYGTTGTAEENAWSLAKARYDAESLYYRGNGAVDVLADTEIGSKPAERNYIVYGNADTNSAYGKLVGDGQIRVDRREVVVGRHRIAGQDLAAFFIRPLRNSSTASVAVVGGTGLAGCRLTERAPFFSSGAGYPDFLVLGLDSLSAGTKGIRAAGYFDNSWEFSEANSAFQIP